MAFLDNFTIEEKKKKSFLSDFVLPTTKANQPNTVSIAPKLTLNSQTSTPMMSNTSFNPFTAAANLAKDTFRAFTKGSARIGAEVGSLLTGNKNPIRVVPQTKSEQLAFGTDPITGFKDYGSQTLQGFGLNPDTAGKFGIPLGIGLTALDVYPGGAGSKKVAEKLAKETSEEVIKSILKKEVKNIAVSNIDNLAAKIAKTTDPTVVKSMLEQSLSKTSAPQAGQVFREELKKTQGPLERLIDDSVSSLDIKPKTPNLQVNVGRYNLDDEAKNVITKTIEDIKPKLESKIGNVMSNKEVLDLAQRSNKVLTKEIGYDQTKEFAASMVRLSEDIAQMAKQGKVTEEFINALKIDKTNATNLGRLLQARSIQINPVERPVMEEVMRAVLDNTDNMDEVIKASQGVDFNDFKQASDFYRQFIKPKAGEWIDLLRYNSMLTSPKTHITNVVSNAINTAVVSPVTKLVTGGFDFLGSAVTGKEQTQFAGETLPYLKGYFSNIGKATRTFGKVMSGTKEFTNLDTRAIPLAISGLKGKTASVLGSPLKLLEGMDQFFTEMATAGEKAALDYRIGKGVNVPTPAVQAAQNAAYNIYRQPLFVEGQGNVLNAIDTFTSKLQSLRNSPNPVVSIPAKFTVPFLQTPMNIAKQGVEYSPLGFSTVFGAGNKTEQLAKAAIGSAIFAGAGLLGASNRLTFGEPVSTKDKGMWRDAGKQPYSVKVGDKWISYQKMPPPISFPLAMTAALLDAQKQKKLDDSKVDIILSSIAKYGQFLSDQTYAKSIGDLLSAFKGGENGVAKLISNYPQQLIPFRALGGWMAKLIDDTQRLPDAKGFVDKQIQMLMLNIPGLSQKVPARTNVSGEPIKNTNNVLNSFSPFNVTTENSKAAEFLNNYDKYKKVASDYAVQKDALRQKAMTKYEELSSLPNQEEVAKQYKELYQSNRQLAEMVTDIYEEKKLGLSSEEIIIKRLGVEDGTRPQAVFDKIQSLKTPEEKESLWKDYVTKKIITKPVAEKVIELLNQEQNPIQEGPQSNTGTASKILGALTGAKTASAAELPGSPIPQAPTIKTKDGVNLREVPQEWKPLISKAYEEHPGIQKYKGIIEAILMQESSMGAKDTNYNSKIGESAWLGGLTKIAKEELEKRGIKANFDTQAGVIDAIAKFLDIKRKVKREDGTVVEYKDPVNLYVQRYKTAAGIKLKPEQVEKFRKYINYYANT